MAGKHRTTQSRKLSRRELLAFAIATPVIGAGLGAYRNRRQSVTEIAQEAATTPTPIPLSATQPLDAQPVIDHLRGRSSKSWGTDLPGIVKTVPTVPGKRTVALTFDACGGGSGVAVDTDLLAVLREFRVPATLFLNARWITANPALTEQLIADPLFSIQNHGTRHLPLSVSGQAAYHIPGTATLDEALAEVRDNQDQVRMKYGHEMTWFRSGTAHYDDVCVDMCNAIGVRIAGFTTNIDFGATAAASKVKAAVSGMPDGAIGLGHMNHPGSGTAAGVKAALTHMQDVNFVQLV